MNQTGQVLVIIAWAAALIPSLVWVARDDRRRKKGFAIVMLCLFTFPLGILLWLLLRPDIPLDDSVT